jgi:branched-chain amino acid transport system substrate-binding protein
LPEVYGFDLVYKGALPLGTVDFSSYFAVAEAAGVEIMLPLFTFEEATAFVKEYYERQSPMVVYGGALGVVGGLDGWEITEGKCEYTSCAGLFPMISGYPLTNRTLPVREAYITRWNEIPGGNGVFAYDILRYILPDAVKRAGTLEVDAVIEALEKTSVETTSARNLVFTSSHDVMIGENLSNPAADYYLVIIYQWQDAKQVPVYPKKIMEEAGATYIFPDWPGPWNK